MERAQVGLLVTHSFYHSFIHSLTHSRITYSPNAKTRAELKKEMKIAREEKKKENEAKPKTPYKKFCDERAKELEEEDSGILLVLLKFIRRVIQG